MLVDRWIAIAKMETAGVEGSARSSDQSDLDEGDMGEGVSTTARKSIHGLLPHLGSVEPRLHQGFQPRKSRQGHHFRVRGGRGRVLLLGE